MPLVIEAQQSVLGETLSAAIGRAHRDDPVTPSTGGPAGNARLTAWVGLVLLVLFVVECATLLSLSSLIAVHIFLGVFLLPLVLLKTVTTGWRMFRYYSRSAHYLEGGPPPLLLRLLGPLVILGALAVLGTGISLVALGQSAHDRLFSFVGFGVDAVTLHQAAFVLWLSTTGLHVLGRFVPALQLSRLAPTSGNLPPRVPGSRARIAVFGLTTAIAALTGVLVLHLSGSWTNSPWHHDRHERSLPVEVGVPTSSQ
jgi:hypothetical protein